MTNSSLSAAKTVSLQAGQQYSLCTCGQSKSLPYCDDTHKLVNKERGTSFRSLKVKVAKDTAMEVFSANWPQ